jgi:hypothetical protein
MIPHPSSHGLGQEHLDRRWESPGRVVTADRKECVIYEPAQNLLTATCLPIQPVKVLEKSPLSLAPPALQDEEQHYEQKHVGL